MLELPPTIDVRTPSGDVIEDQPMWTYWNLQEGEIQVDPQMFATANGSAPPVVHLDTDAPLHTDEGELITDEPGGHLLQARLPRRAGAAPRRWSSRATSSWTPTRPRPTWTRASRTWCAAPSHAMSRFEGRPRQYGPLGGVGAFTADNFVFDYMRPERLHDPRLEPRLQDDRGRPRGGELSSSATTRASCTRSASSASRRATSTRSRIALPLVVTATPGV